VKKIFNLRTVRVTAAVYWTFDSSRERLLFGFQHRAGIKRYTASCEFATFCVFSKQSLSPMLCQRRVFVSPTSEGSESICRVPSREVTQSPWCSDTCPPVLVWYGAPERRSGFPGCFLEDVHPHTLPPPGGEAAERPRHPGGFPSGSVVTDVHP
jgi:hypothetical protein